MNNRVTGLWATAFCAGCVAASFMFARPNEKPAASMLTNGVANSIMIDGGHMSNGLIVVTNLGYEIERRSQRPLAWNDIEGGITNYSRTAMEAGFIIGWEARRQSVRREDYFLLRDAIFSNRIDTVVQWFATNK